MFIVSNKLYCNIKNRYLSILLGWKAYSEMILMYVLILLNLSDREN